MKREYSTITLRCRYCNKPFEKASKPKANGQRRLRNVRNFNAITCSKVCAVAYRRSRWNRTFYKSHYSNEYYLKHCKDICKFCNGVKTKGRSRCRKCYIGKKYGQLARVGSLRRKPNSV